MANTVSNVRVGKPLASGGVLIGPLGVATPPTSAASAPGTGFKPGGYVSDAGLVQTIDADSTPIVAWGGDTVRTVQTSHDLTFKLTLIETNEVSAGVYYGAEAVTVDDETGERTTRVTSVELAHNVWVFEMLDGTHRMRVVVPDGQVTERGDVTYSDAEAVAGELTVTCYPDAAGVKAYIFESDLAPADLG